MLSSVAETAVQCLISVSQMIRTVSASEGQEGWGGAAPALQHVVVALVVVVISVEI